MERMANSYYLSQPAALPRPWTASALSAQALMLVAAAFLLPAGAHLAGLPVRWLLPMHWPVMVVALCYGWRSGTLVGLAAPVGSFLLSGHPLPHILPAMTVELAAYGLLAGAVRHQLKWSAPIAIVAAAVGGRAIFIGMVALTGAAGGPLVPYLQAAVLPGLAAGLGQALLLPPLAGWWSRREASDG